MVLSPLAMDLFGTFVGFWPSPVWPLHGVFLGQEAPLLSTNQAAAQPATGVDASLPAASALCPEQLQLSAGHPTRSQEVQP